jgi:hypothetical protein
MTTVAMADDVIASKLPDIDDVSLTADVAIDAIEYAQIMRDIVGDDKSVTPVSAFNSSI